MSAPEWLENCIIEGLQTMLVLRLPYSPAADTIIAVSNIWVMAFMDGRSWEESRDLPRIQQAFMKVIRTTDTWVPPAVVLKALPPLPPQPLLPEPDPVVDPVHVARCKAKIDEAQKHIFKRIQRK